MYINKNKLLIAIATVCFLSNVITVYAADIDISDTLSSYSTELQDVTVTVDGSSDTGEYTTIQVRADGFEPLLYAIDSDAPDAFQSSNEFYVERGSEHIIYVKDAAGKISAQKYKVPMSEIEMEVNIGYSDTSSIRQVTDEEIEAAEDGGGTVAEQVVTDDSPAAERVFYTITTKDEHVFYIVIDQSRSDNNVYLLDQVTDEDLFALTGSAPDNSDSEKDIIDLVEQVSADTGNNLSGENKKSGAGDFLLYGFIILAMAGTFYYYKVYKPKMNRSKELDDAMDMDEFEAEDQDDVIDFAVSKEEKEAVLNEIINKNDFDDDELTYDPYAEEERELNTEQQELLTSGSFTEENDFDEELDGEEEEDE